MLDHENILPFLGLAEYFPKEPLCFVSPYVKNGNVRHYLEVNPDAPRLPLVSLRFVSTFTMSDYRKIRGIANGLTYLHSQGIIHGDLKGVSSK